MDQGFLVATQGIQEHPSDLVHQSEDNFHGSQNNNPAMTSPQSAGTGPEMNDTLSDTSDQSAITHAASEPGGTRTTETIKIYERKPGNHLAAAWMILRFLKDNDGAKDVKRVGEALLGQEAFMRGILELDLDAF